MTLTADDFKVLDARINSLDSRFSVIENYLENHVATRSQIDGLKEDVKWLQSEMQELRTENPEVLAYSGLTL